MWLSKRNLAGLLFAAAIVLANSAFAAQSDRAHYARCLALTTHDPAIALGDATTWAGAHGGPPAEHCAALALVGLKRYGEAAQRLDALARGRGVESGMRAEIFDQAGNAWILAGEGAHAVASLQAALALSAGDPDLFADLGRAEAMIKNWNEVVLDLNAALALRPRRADLLILRGSAHRALHHYTEARKDLDAALALKPGDGDALLERGLLKRDVGDPVNARADLAAARRAGPPAVARDAAEALDLLR
jgi:tetratricopeptide (TPR) repeat protein